MDTIEYPYKPKPELMYRGFFFFGAGSILLAWTADHNKNGLVLNGIIHLDPHGATLFYWGLTAVCALVAATALMMSLFGLFSSQVLSVSETVLSAPKWLLSPANTVIPLSSITRLELKSVRNQHFLSVHHHEGKLTITAANLPNAEAFGLVCARLADRHHLGGALPDAEPLAYTQAPLQGQPFTRPEGEKAGLLRVLLVVAVFAVLLFTALGVIALLKMAWAQLS
ncbi:hypothetical protein [Dongia sp.]|uniref:hypothetical protein n=1 Tax=Dongia sp. TaxID=1977262 RepID=UPI00375057DB